MLSFRNPNCKKNTKFSYVYKCSKCNWFNFCPGCILSPDEIREVLGLNDENEETNRLVNEIIKDVDINGDGQISYEEFKTMMKRNQNLITG